MVAHMRRGNGSDNQIDYILWEFKEFPAFTEAVAELMSDLEYAKFQSDLMLDPLAGDLIKGTGGARKVRVGLRGVGKRGGGRVVYYYQAGNVIHLLLLYRKSVQENLTADQARVVRAAVDWIRKGEA